MAKIEDTCEEMFYHFTDIFEDVKEENKKSKSKFQDTIEVLYRGFFLQNPQWERWEWDIIDRWTTKIRAAAGEWYVENIQRKREEEERRLAEQKEREERERREIERERQRERERLKREEEERERERKREIKEQIRNLNETFKKNDLSIQKQVNSALSENSVDGLNQMLSSLDNELEKIKGEISELPEYCQDKCDEWIEKISEYKEQVENQISVLEEQERIARRKAQEEANRRQLEQMQAQWRGSQNPQSNSPVDNSAVNIKSGDGASCPQCGNPVSSTAKFCTSCGTKLSVTCSNCGTTLKSTAKFCTACGTSVSNN